ncbi:MAG: YitT family protein [Ruminococcus sp.]|nr:YitT family protein [Ruminococcus sp.]
MKRKAREKKIEKIGISDIIIIFAGCVLYALSIVLFISPNNIAPGGVIGISTLINYTFDFLPLGTMSLILNIPLFIWGFVVLGWKYLSRSVICTGISSVLIDLFNFVIDLGYIRPYTGDGLLVSIFGGLFCGAGLALIFYRGGSTGGTDIVARIMHEKTPHISQGNFMLSVDALVVLVSAFVYGNIENALYAIICIFVMSRTIDTILYGVSRNNGKLLFIVTSKYDEVTDTILRRVDRGVTLLKAEGGFRRDDKRVILCAVRSNQVHLTNQLVHQIDPEAFAIVTTANAIKGRGFYSYDESPNPAVHESLDVSSTDAENTQQNS